jgi:hypothetical protein
VTVEDAGRVVVARVVVARVVATTVVVGRVVVVASVVVTPLAVVDSMVHASASSGEMVMLTWRPLPSVHSTSVPATPMTTLPFEQLAPGPAARLSSPVGMIAADDVINSPSPLGSLRTKNDTIVPSKPTTQEYSTGLSVRTPAGHVGAVTFTPIERPSCEVNAAIRSDAGVVGRSGAVVMTGAGLAAAARFFFEAADACGP